MTEQKRVALITGGSRGLGLQMAHALGEAGARVLPLRIKVLASSLDGRAREAARERNWSELVVNPFDPDQQSAFIADQEPVADRPRDHLRAARPCDPRGITDLRLFRPKRRRALVMQREIDRERLRMGVVASRRVIAHRILAALTRDDNLDVIDGRERGEAFQLRPRERQAQHLRRDHLARTDFERAAAQLVADALCLGQIAGGWGGRHWGGGREVLHLSSFLIRPRFGQPVGGAPPPQAARPPGAQIFCCYKKKEKFFQKSLSDSKKGLLLHPH